MSAPGMLCAFSLPFLAAAGSYTVRIKLQKAGVCRKLQLWLCTCQDRVQRTVPCLPHSSVSPAGRGDTCLLPSHPAWPAESPPSNLYKEDGAASSFHTFPNLEGQSSTHLSIPQPDCRVIMKLTSGFQLVTPSSVSTLQCHLPPKVLKMRI